MITVGTTMANIATVIRRLRPTTSASAPVKGADNAIAAVPAVISALIAPAPTPNSCASSGSSACGEYRLTNDAKPAVATAMVRESTDLGVGVMSHYGRGEGGKHPLSYCDAEGE